MGSKDVFVGVIILIRLAQRPFPNVLAMKTGHWQQEC